MLDDILADQSCKNALRDALQKELLKNPVRFFRSIIMPLLPPEQRVTLSHEMGAVTWQPLMDVVKSQLSQLNPAQLANLTPPKLAQLTPAPSGTKS